MPLHPIGPESSAGHQPGTPTIGSASAGNASASVSFTAPNYLGKPIATTYSATSTPGSITGTGSSSPITVSGLSNGTSYTFKVKLGNSIVDSLESAASNSVIPSAPPPPPYFPYFAPPPSLSVSITSVNPTNYNGSVSFNMSGQQSYSLTIGPYDSGLQVGSQSSATLSASGLTPGTNYTAFVNVYSDTQGLGNNASASAAFNTPALPPPYFPYFAPPPPYFPYFAPEPPPPFFPGFGFSEYSIASTTGVMTINGRKDAKDLIVGDILVAMEITSENINDPSFDWTQWYQENITLNEGNLRETEIISIQERDVSVLYVVNGDAYSESHYVLTKKDNISRFIRVSELDNTYMIYSYQDLDFIPIENLDVVEYEDKVYSINCEPYDNFFTENMLVFDTRD